MHIALDSVDIAAGDHVTFIQDAEAVTNVFQLTDIVTGDDHRHAVFLYAARQCPLKHQPHHRVKTIEDLIQKQQPRTNGKCENDEGLPFHAFGEL